MFLANECTVSSLPMRASLLRMSPLQASLFKWIGLFLGMALLVSGSAVAFSPPRGIEVVTIAGGLDGKKYEFQAVSINLAQVRRVDLHFDFDSEENEFRPISLAAALKAKKLSAYRAFFGASYIRTYRPFRPAGYIHHKGRDLQKRQTYNWKNDSIICYAPDRKSFLIFHVGEKAIPKQVNFCFQAGPTLVRNWKVERTDLEKLGTRGLSRNESKDLTEKRDRYFDRSLAHSFYCFTGSSVKVFFSKQDIELNRFQKILRKENRSKKFACQHLVRFIGANRMGGVVRLGSGAFVIGAANFGYPVLLAFK